jgi:hypothetical protein
MIIMSGERQTSRRDNGLAPNPKGVIKLREQVIGLRASAFFALDWTCAFPFSPSNCGSCSNIVSILRGTGAKSWPSILQAPVRDWAIFDSLIGSNCFWRGTEADLVTP